MITTMKIFFHIVFLLIIAFGVSSCSTTPPAPPHWKPLESVSLENPLTLEQCLKLARENDIVSMQWKARYDAAHADLQKAKTLPNPTLGLAWDDVGVSDDTGKSLSSLTYGFSYPILFWWPREKKIAVAEANRLAEEATQRLEQRTLANEIATAYFGLVGDQRKVALSGEIIKIADESIRLVLKKKELKISSDYDIQQIRTEHIKAESDVADAIATLRQDQLAFAFALGADKPMFPKVVDCTDVCTVFVVDVSSETIPDSILATALQSDPNWVQKKALTKAAESQLALEQMMAFPLSDLMGSAGPKKDQEGWARMSGLDIPIPLFDRNQGGIKRAEAELKTAQAEEENARRSAVAAISETWERYRAAMQKWNTYSKLLTSFAEKNEAAARKFFDAGQIGYTELLLAQKEYKQAQLDEIKDWQEVSTAAYVLDCLAGK